MLYLACFVTVSCYLDPQFLGAWESPQVKDVLKADPHYPFPSSMTLRAAFSSDTIYTPDTLPRDFALALPANRTFDETHSWFWFPSAPAADPPTGISHSGSPLRPTTGPKGGPPATTASGRTRPRTAPAPLRYSRKAEPASPPSLALRRVVGFSGDKPGLLLWLREPELLACCAASALIVQRVDTSEQRVLLGHTAPICALVAAADGRIIATAQVIYTHTHTYIYIYIYIYIYMYIHTYIHTYIYTYINMYMYMYMFM